MLDVLTAAQQRLFDSGKPRDVAIATIIAADGSVPRPIGTSMLVDADGAVHGSLTGGCVEGAVLEACLEALATGIAAVQRFGYSDEDAFSVGLMCGGTIEVLVQPFRAGDRGLLEGAGQVAPVAVAMRLPSAAPGQADGAVVVREESEDSLADVLDQLVPQPALRPAAQRTAAMIRSGRTGRVRVAAPEGDREPVELFVETRIAPAHLIIFGANAFGEALAAAAGPLGCRITLCDPRPAFTDPTSFPGAEVVREWPHRFLAEAAEAGELDARSMICVLTHDPKVDTPALVCALDLDVAYVGAMGSRRSDRDRRSALREAGVSDQALERLHSPIGLGLSALTPAEVAVSILAEVLAVRGGHTQIESLSRSAAPLHPNAG